MSGSQYTFRSNRSAGRHGWLRLTPAYSKRAVDEILDAIDEPGVVLDPFCGTGTTALACAERGLAAVSIELNPFLVWFARAKTDVYTEADAAAARKFAAGPLPAWSGEWMPPIANIDRWWAPEVARELAVLFAAIERADVGDKSCALLKVAFCRASIETSRASFGHQSMSFASPHDISQKIYKDVTPQVRPLFTKALEDITESAVLGGPSAPPRILQGDARRLDDLLEADGAVQTVITSPPYPNRMSYVRELRPYMYWLGYLQSGADAGELDWRAIGGTWGKATSNLTRWQPEEALPPRLAHLGPVLSAIGVRSSLLARYVERYIFDMRTHVGSLMRVVSPGARVAYIVGNSRFYDVMVDTEQILAAIFADAGLAEIEVRPLRKRTSKRELWEFVVFARVPSSKIDPRV